MEIPKVLEKDCFKKTKYVTLSNIVYALNLLNRCLLYLLCKDKLLHNKYKSTVNKSQIN